MDVLRWIHLVAMAGWIGGMIVVGAIMPALRRSGASTDIIKAVARRFGVVAWTALGVSILTGIGQLAGSDVDYERGPFAVKLLLVGLAAGLAYTHQLLGGRASGAVRGALQGLLLLDGLAIVAVAIAL